MNIAHQYVRTLPCTNGHTGSYTEASLDTKTLSHHKLTVPWHATTETNGITTAMSGIGTAIATMAVDFGIRSHALSAAVMMKIVTHAIATTMQARDLRASRTIRTVSAPCATG